LLLDKAANFAALLLFEKQKLQKTADLRPYRHLILIGDLMTFQWAWIGFNHPRFS
jgi:hypothetical protein